jgi:hypothetical protein
MLMMIASQESAKQISEFQEAFQDVAHLSSLLYFYAYDFSVIDPMYQFSLN